ncbi:MAG: two-component system sensor histidine kinase NtrB [Planctomycetota bacterium]|jgi:two-component system sensor kinase FixL
MKPTDPVDRQSLLYTELRWFVRLRWFAGLAVMAGALAYGFRAGWSADHTKALAVGAAILAYNLVIWALFRARREAVDRREVLSTLAWTQMGLDLVCLTILTLITGGISSPLLGLFVLHMIFASLLLPRLTSYVAATGAMVLLFGGLGLTDQWVNEPLKALTALGWMLMLLLTAYLTNHITRNLRRRETELRRQHRRTQAILDTAAEGIITIDEEGIIRSVNPAAEQIFGYTVPELIGRNVRILMSEPDKTEHDTYIADYLRTGEAKIIGVGREVVGRRKTGATFPLEIAVSEVSLGRQRIFTAMIRDITERKRAEAELKALNEAIKSQQQALIQHEKMAAMGQMAAGVAHEISNPLASMDSVLQLVKRQPGQLPPETIATLRQQVERINRIVRQMTAFAHPNETDWATMPLNTVVEGALGMVRFDHRIRDVEVVRELAPEAGTIHLMPQAVQQVLVNIILNALDALAEKAEPRLVVATRREDSWCVIDVTDNGKGIAPEHIDHVFEPFFTTKPLGQGTGLGLSISYNLIERHHGRCEVRSTPGQGATFSIHLPASGPPSCIREGPDDPIPSSENHGT